MAKKKKNKKKELMEECPHCNGMYRGLGIHIAKKHKQMARQNIVQSYQPIDEIPQNTEDVNADEDENDALKGINLQMVAFHTEFEKMTQVEPTLEAFSSLVIDFSEVMSKSVEILPGPKHPATKYYNARKNEQVFSSQQPSYKEQSNPERKSKREQKRKDDSYNHDLIQHLYTNSRKKAVQMVMPNTTSSPRCKIPQEEIVEHYTKRWGTPNNKVLEDYGPLPTLEDQSALDEQFDPTVTVDEIKASLKGINKDTSSGVDRVSIRCIKAVKCKEVIADIATIMIKWNLVPNSFRKARTVLLYKKGDPKDIGNWRPISICSILRRIIDRVFERQLREYVRLNSNQRGFSNLPGCQINTSILNAVLQKAKKDKLSCYILLFDVQKAFEESGHNHICECFDHTMMPSKLRSVSKNLLIGNQTQFHTKKGMSKPIQVEKGVFQGLPESPLEFNMSVDHVHKELSETEITEAYGFKLHSDLAPLTNAGFADDLAVISGTEDGVKELGRIALFNLSKVDYQSNPTKCKAICIKDGEICEDSITLYEGFEIEALKKHEKIKYLGVNFNDEIVFDAAETIRKFGKDLEALVSTPMLRPHQKLAILNQYIWPTLIYPLQSAPLTKIPKKFIQDLNNLLAKSVKEIIGLPDDVPKAMLYSPKKFRGLQLINAEWEVFLQHYNICLALLKCGDPIVPYVRDCQAEMGKCAQALGVTNDDLDGWKASKEKTKVTKLMREKLRREQYDHWSNLLHRGAGVALFQESPYCNKLILNKNGLTSSEWVAMMKMSVNVFPVRSLPGRSQDGSQCRHTGCFWRETLPHVLGSCEKGDLLRNARHNVIREIIANYLREEQKWIVKEEVDCVGENDSTRRVDILCYDQLSKTGYIIDPTIRWEIDREQPFNVDFEKKKIYEPCIPYFQEKYGLQRMEVIGLLVGARGTIPSFFEEFRKRFHLPEKLIKDVIIAAVRGSYRIAFNHLYN